MSPQKALPCTDASRLTYNIWAIRTRRGHPPPLGCLSFLPTTKKRKAECIRQLRETGFSLRERIDSGHTIYLYVTYGYSAGSICAEFARKIE